MWKWRLKRTFISWKEWQCLSTVSRWSFHDQDITKIWSEGSSSLCGPLLFCFEFLILYAFKCYTKRLELKWRSELKVHHLHVYLFYCLDSYFEFLISDTCRSLHWRLLFVCDVLVLKRVLCLTCRFCCKCFRTITVTCADMITLLSLNFLVFTELYLLVVKR